MGDSWLPLSFVLSFREGIRLARLADGSAALEWTGGRRFPLGGLSPALTAALAGLEEGTATGDALGQRLLDAGGAAELPAFYLYLHQLLRSGTVCCGVMGNGGPLATLLPVSPGFQLSVPQVDPEARYLLSRFAYCRRDGGRMVLESPLAHARILLHSPAGAAIVAACAAPRTSIELLQDASGLSEETVSRFMGLLLAANMLTEAVEDGSPQEDRQPALLQWEFHDLLFHAASRLGRHDRPYGANLRFLGKVPPLPAVKPELSERLVNLYRPDIERLKLGDPPFTRVLEERRSIRDPGEEPITLQQFGEFLYRVARVRETRVEELPGQVLYEESGRPYPNGGACYELELYLTVHACRGLEPGVYHYNPRAHRLAWLSAPGPLSDEPLEHTRVATGERRTPNILITITARFQRLSWKYDAIAYATVLKDVGVLYQTMYLVATAMGLAPCALGGGNADTAAEAFGLDYYAESSVGEFVLSSRPPD